MEHSRISVTFIDDAASETIGTVDQPVADLPDTFALETTLTLGETEWSVVHAEPQTKAEFSRSGTLVLRLRRIEMVAPSEILFSLPSICDRLPAVEDMPIDDDQLVLGEDDWRQFELVSRAFAAESDAEIAAIRSIHENEGTGFGWKRIHVRKRPDPPIASSLSRHDIDRIFGGVTFRGVCLEDASIASGFSFQSDNLLCYGLEEGGAVTVLGIAGEPAPGEAVEALVRIAREFDLDLVHWCRCARVAWDDPLFRQLLTGAI